MLPTWLYVLTMYSIGSCVLALLLGAYLKPDDKV